MGHLPQDILSAFADDELQPAEAVRAREHLAGCAACRAELADYARFDAALAAPPALSCEAALPLLSAHFDAESDPHEAAAAAAHLTACDSCRSLRQEWLATDTALRQLPTGAPSARVDGAIAALRGRERVRRPAPDWRRIATAPLLAGGAVVAGASLVLSLVSGGQAPKVALQPAPQIAANTVVIGPVAVQEVLNTKTNTLYSLRPATNQVAALDPFSKLTRATITVPAKPITLAVNEDANKVYVLDVQRSLVEIDGATNTVVSTTPDVVTGTPTAISYDSAKQQIVVAAQAPVPTAAPTAAPSAGVVVVLDSSTKTQLQSKTTDAAAQVVVLDDSGTRALLVSKDAATIVDAITYQPSIKLPGGVAGAFAANKGPVAIISSANGGTRLAFFGSAAPQAVDIEGAPVAITALPDGGFGVLTNANGKGRVYVVDRTGKVSDRLDVAAISGSLVYDASTKQFAVVGGDVTYAAAPSATPSAAPTAQSTATLAPSAQPSASAGASASPASSTAPSPTPTSAPTASSPIALAKPSSSPLPAPAGATLVWTGTYRVELPYGKKVQAAAIDPLKTRIWFVDQNRVLNAMRTSDYAIFPIAQLPGGANIDALLVGYTHVYAVDKAGVQLYDLTIAGERLTSQSFGPLRDGVGFSLTPDDQLWFGRGTQLMSYDPRARHLSIIETGVTGITALTTDSGARVWFSGSNDKLEMYDARVSRITDYTLPHHGAAVAMMIDGSGTVWIATDASELLSVVNGTLILSAHTAQPYTSFAIDEDGLVWGINTGAGGTHMAPVDGSRTQTLIPGTTGGVFFDAGGRAWLAERTAGVFYTTESAP